MQTKTITVSREQIQSTQAFQKANKVIQNVTLNKTNVGWIQHGVNVATNIGFENWQKQTTSSFTNRQIIQELINQEND